MRRQDIAFVQQLKAGWNLGNTLDSHGLFPKSQRPEDYETYWGNPKTTRELIREVKRAGFQTIRIPVTWYEHMDQQGRVDQDFMERVAEIVDLSLAEGLYTILNAHHEPWQALREEPEEIALSAKVLWGEIGRRFAAYDRRLIFELMNEPRSVGSPWEWTAGTKAARQQVLRMNRLLSEAVRQSGGSNSCRYLLVPAYCARDEEEALWDFEMPPGEQLILSVHYYKPYDFAMNQSGRSSFFDEADRREIERLFTLLSRSFIKRGIPVIISEFGAVHKDNTRERARYAAAFAAAAKARGIPWIWWDNGRLTGPEAFGLLDRSSLSWAYPDIAAALIR